MIMDMGISLSGNDNKVTRNNGKKLYDTFFN